MALSITPVAPESSVSTRELVVLGTASQVPTRYRNHNGYLLLWDGQGLLFDPGEGTQRQMTFAGVSATDITRILITHFHGDHSLGLAGICQRISLDRVPHTVPVHFPASGERFYWRLKRASIYHDVSDMAPCPIEEGGVIASAKDWSLSCLPLDHGVEAFGYRLAERDSVRMLPDKLAERGIRGRDIGVLQRTGSITLDGVRTDLADVSEHKAGQKVAFVMDTRLCDACFELADGADMLICESTYLNREKKEARAHGHMTAREAGLVAQEAGVRTLVLTHFSQRYPMNAPFKREAAEVFDGEIVVAEDGLRVPVPKR